jgi:hypothetical protein
MQLISTIGLDIAKSVFQVHGVDAAGQVVLRRLDPPLDRRARWSTRRTANISEGWRASRFFFVFDSDQRFFLPLA